MFPRDRLDRPKSSEGVESRDRAGVTTLAPADLDTITAELVDAIKGDAEFASRVAQHLGSGGLTALRTIDELIANDEDFAVEFKSTAR